MSLLVELTKMFEGEEAPQGPWINTDMAEGYTHRGYPLGLKISTESSQLIRDMYRGRHSKEALYILIDYDGDVSRQHSTVISWPEAVYSALTSNLIIYNTRSKKCSRPCWMPGATRTLRNLIFESVWCIPSEQSLNSLPSKRSRLFALDNFTFLGKK